LNGRIELEPAFGCQLLFKICGTQTHWSLAAI
jgi:hypothetical protein